MIELGGGSAFTPARLQKKLTLVRRANPGIRALNASFDHFIDVASKLTPDEMNVLDRLVLRLAVYEFLHQPDTPATVIINEALELARAFSSDEAVPFVNGILDAIKRRLERT